MPLEVGKEVDILELINLMGHERLNGLRGIRLAHQTMTFLFRHALPLLPQLASKEHQRLVIRLKEQSSFLLLLRHRVPGVENAYVVQKTRNALLVGNLVIGSIRGDLLLDQCAKNRQWISGRHRCLNGRPGDGIGLRLFL